MYFTLFTDHPVEGASDSSSNNTSGHSSVLSGIEQLLANYKPSLILGNGSLKEIHKNSKTTTTPTTIKTVTLTTLPITKTTTTVNHLEVDQNNIETMMNSLVDSVIEKFDNELPQLLDELTTLPSAEEVTLNTENIENMLAEIQEIQAESDNSDDLNTINTLEEVVNRIEAGTVSSTTITTTVAY